MSESAPRSARKTRLLVIDDDPSVGLIAQELFPDSAYVLQHALTGREGLALFDARRPDVVVLDHILPDTTGLELLSELSQRDPRLPIVFVAAKGTGETAIQAMKQGAFDFLSKPLDFDQLIHQVQHAAEARRLMLVPVELASQQVDELRDLLVGRCQAMQEVYKSIGRVALQEMPLLLQGETGTGKELVARAIYQHGPRANLPFLKISCSDFTGPWLESELFGHVDHAFTGAGGSRVGKFEQCAGGTLLLEELAAIPPSTQGKLLRVIRERVFQRLGGNESLTANVALIFTTTTDAEQLLAEGRLRPDLYYLLSPFRIALPPLRERTDDLPLLVDHFVAQFSRIQGAVGGKALRVSPEAQRLLAQYTWPGNVSELRGVLRRALIETNGTVLATDYLRKALRLEETTRPQRGEFEDSQTDWRQFVETKLAGEDELYAAAINEMERHLLRAVLTRTLGNQAHAAKLLGMSRTSLRKKIAAHGISIDTIVTAADRPVLAGSGDLP